VSGRSPRKGDVIVPKAARFALVIGLLIVSSRVEAASIFIDFEALTELDAVNGLVGPDVAFANATVLTAASLLNELDFPPKSGANVAADDGGPMRLDFATPLVSFSGFFTYEAALTLAFFDTSSNLLGTVTSSHTDNTGSGGLGPPNELLSGALAGAAYLTITGNPLGGSFVLDDVSIETATVAPEPSILALIGAGLVAAIRSRRGGRRVAR
jgi:hypothetical protein